MIARVSTPSQGAVSFSRVLASQSSQLGLPASRLRIAHKSNRVHRGRLIPIQRNILGRTAGWFIPAWPPIQRGRLPQHRAADKHRPGNTITQMLQSFGACAVPGVGNSFRFSMAKSAVNVLVRARAG